MAVGVRDRPSTLTTRARPCGPRVTWTRPRVSAVSRSRAAALREPGDRPVGVWAASAPVGAASVVTPSTSTVPIVEVKESTRIAPVRPVRARGLRAI